MDKKYAAYLHATRGWKKGDPPGGCKNVIAVETHEGKLLKWSVGEE